MIIKATGTRPATVSAPILLDDVEPCVDAIIARVGKDLKVGLPLGLGKPAELVNALYRRAKADPGLRLTLLTALSLEKPVPGSKIEAAFLTPFLDRVFEGVVELDYTRDVTAQRLPPNVRVVEFFFRPGSRLGNAQAQRDYISTNYTFAARDIMAQGCNVAMQAVAKRETAEGTRYSLSCNPDTSPELAALMRATQAAGEREVVLVAVVNPQLPYMANDAEVRPEVFDLVVDHARYASALFSTPKTPVTPPDYAIGLYASALVPDGGTLQIGIGALGDAIVHALRLRHQDNARYAALMQALGVTGRWESLVAGHGGVAPFAQGLYGATEMFVDGFWQLMRAGILKRAVYDFWALQQLINEGLHDPTQAPTRATLEALDRLGLRVIRKRDFEILQHHGFFNDETRYDNGYLVAADGERVMANVADPQARALMAAKCLGQGGLRRGIVLHAGFFLGPRDFYQGLRDMPQAQRDTICMTGVDKVNQLDLNPRLYKAQRQGARFINTGMMATLNGAVVSDGLADGRVVSGVGGQYNFVAMAHQLPGGRSILVVRAARQPEDGGEASSNLLFNYAHTTIPRHLRDILITEYGIADLRAQTDSEVAKRVLNIADSRFQPALLAQAQAAGSIEAGYAIPEAYRNNTPDALDRRLAAAREQLPAFPFGCDLSAEELTLARALKAVKTRSTRTPKWQLARELLGAQARQRLRAFRAARARAPTASRWQHALEALRPLPEVPEAIRPYLVRMCLLEPSDLEQAIARELLIDALRKTLPSA